VADKKKKTGVHLEFIKFVNL